METPRSLFAVHTPLPSSTHPHSLTKPHALSTSYPSFHFLSLFPSISSPPSSTCRKPPFPTRAEPFEGAESRIADDLSSSVPPPPSPPPNTPSDGGFGFGTDNNGKNRRKGKGRSAVVRRSPIDRPSILVPPGGESRLSKDDQSATEGAFLLAWLGLGLVILVEGIALAASGFLPEQWDNFFVKYLYPSFTPTCAVFICGTVVYGVLKYLQAEKMKS